MQNDLHYNYQAMSTEFSLPLQRGDDQQLELEFVLDLDNILQLERYP